MTDQGNVIIPPAIGDGRVWLRIGTVVDGTGGPPLQDAHIVYDRREIIHLGGPATPPPADSVNPGQRQPDLDLPDYTLLPGLIKAHAHFFLEGGELEVAKRSVLQKQTPESLLSAARARLGKLARLGVIAVRDAGDKDGVGLALSWLYRSAQRPLMPYVDSPGAAISTMDDTAGSWVNRWKSIVPRAPASRPGWRRERTGSS